MENEKEKDGITRRKLLTLLVTTLGGAAVLKFLNNSNLGQKISPIEISEVRAADGDPVIVGNSHIGTSKTKITRTAGTGAAGVAFEAEHTGDGFGIIGVSSSGKGVHGISTNDWGVWGRSSNDDGVFGESLSGTSAGVFAQNKHGGFGIFAYSEFSDAIRARSNASSGNGVGVQGFGNVVGDDGPFGTGVRGVGSNIGVKGESITGHGVSGESSNSRGIFGKSSSGSGVYGESNGGNGVRGISTNAAGTYGNSENGSGVRGDSTNSSGVRGSSVNNIGIYGETGSTFPAIEGKNTGSGIGIKAESTSGTALHVEGKNYFKSAQRETIPIDVRTHDITVPAGIAIDNNAMIFVTIMNNSSNIGVRWVERLSDTQFRVHLTGLSRTDMDIGYFIVN